MKTSPAEAYNHRGYKSLWESGERSWLGISAWGVVNLLFKLADQKKKKREKERGREDPDSFPKLKAEEWCSLPPDCRPLQRNFLACVPKLYNSM